MNSFFAALRFLTVIPLPGRRGHEPTDLARALWYFPLVGLLLGGATGGLFYLIAPHLPWSVAPMLAVLLLLSWSGGLHLDGVADCCDGFFSARPKERVLEIMRDSRIGSMGVVGLVMLLGLKWAALVSVPNQDLWKPLLLMPLAGRTGILLMLSVLPYARSEGGLASPFYAAGRKGPALLALVLLAGLGWLVAGRIGLYSVLDPMVLLLLFFLYCYLKIDGATGDTLGAACEIAETLTVLCYAALLNS